MHLCVYFPAHLSVPFPVPLVHALLQWLKWSYLLNSRDHSGVCKKHTWLFCTKWELSLVTAHSLVKEDCLYHHLLERFLLIPSSWGRTSVVIWAPLPALRPQGLSDCLWTSLPGLSCIAQLSLIRTNDDPLPVVFKTEWLNWRTSVFISDTEITVTLFRHDFKLLIRHTFHAAQFTT